MLYWFYVSSYRPQGHENSLIDMKIQAPMLAAISIVCRSPNDSEALLRICFMIRRVRYRLGFQNFCRFCLQNFCRFFFKRVFAEKILYNFWRFYLLNFCRYFCRLDLQNFTRYYLQTFCRFFAVSGFLPIRHSEFLHILPTEYLQIFLLIRTPEFSQIIQT